MMRALVIFALIVLLAGSRAACAADMAPLDESVTFTAPEHWTRIRVGPQTGETRIVGEWRAPTAGLHPGDFWANINVAAQPFRGTVDEYVAGTTGLLGDPALHISVADPPVRLVLCNETPGYEVYLDRLNASGLIHQDEMIVVTSGIVYIATYSFAGDRASGAAGDAALRTLCRAAYPAT